jgi:beta-N-acetylhexosaminidase
MAGANQDPPLPSDYSTRTDMRAGARGATARRRAAPGTRRWPARAVLVVLLLVAAVAVALGFSARHGGHTVASGHGASIQPRSNPGPQPRATPKPSAPLRRMLGQMIVARVSGSRPSSSLLARIRAGQVGGVILFSDSFASGLAVARASIQALQRAARQGGNPPLLVMTDQEGGEVKRVPGPPTLAPSQMSSTAVAFAQGKAAAQLLRSVGVNLDLAPVADVERVAGSFLGTRSFGSKPSKVAADACAFARGVASQQVAYTLKHFPGLGRATGNTDLGPVRINSPATALRTDYAAYRTCGAGSLGIVMISNAIYPALTGSLPAVMSPLTYARELRIATGRSSVVTISDDLQAGAIAGQRAPARHAINAGLDLLMYAGSEQASAAAYSILLPQARSGAVSRARVQAAYDAILALKQRITRHTPGRSPLG